MEVFVALLATVIYFLPTIIAWKKNFILQVFLLNLFLGWTLIGWIAALIWAVKKETKTLSQSETNINTNNIALIEKLSRLQKEGVITEEEFAVQKQKLLTQ